jgi:rSAM/selenodomain-associated transferase 1
MDQDENTAQLTAVCVFVKTPGLSPVKTRLAAGIGQERARRFYELASAAVAAVVQSSGFLGFWAVAEAAGAASWRRFPVILQGEGDLGARLDAVYSTARRQAPRVLLIGADAPQITAALLRQAGAALAKAPFVLGPAADGGFYLMGGARDIPREAWLRTPYSARDTAARLMAELSSYGRVAPLATLTDVDEQADLLRLRDELLRVEEPLQEQLALLRWLDEGLTRCL